MEFIDKSQIMQGIEQDSTADILEKGMSHKYYKREGTPGNYKYYYSEYEYKREKGIPVSLKGELGEIREFEGKFYRKQAEGKWLEVSSDGLTKKEHQDSLKRAQDTERKYLEQESQAPLMIKQEIAKQTSIITKLSDVEIDIEKEENKKYSIFGYREHLIDYGTNNGDKDLVEYAKTASDKQIEQRMKSDKYEEQFQDKTPEKRKDSHDSRFKFHKGTAVSFTHKGEVIQGTISDYDYNFVTFKKEYSIDYKKDGKSLTMIGVPEEKIEKEYENWLKQSNPENKTGKDFKLKHLLKQTENKLKQINVGSIEKHLKKLSEDSRIADLESRLAMDCLHLIYTDKEISSWYKDESVKDNHVLTLAKTALNNIIDVKTMIGNIK